MPGTKPIGPYMFSVKQEAPSFSYESPATTSFLRVSKVDIGDAVQEHIEVPVINTHRGDVYHVLGQLPATEFTVEVPLFGTGTAGTKNTPLAELFEAGGFSTAVSGGTSVTYKSDVDNPYSTFSAYRVDRAGVMSNSLSGCIVTAVNVVLNKTDFPKVIFSCKSPRGVSFVKTALDGALTDVATSGFLADKNISDGTAQSSISSIQVPVEVEAEVINITAFTPATRAMTISRGAYSTSGAAHNDATAVSAWKPTPTYPESGLLLGPQDWTLTLDGSAFKCKEFNYTINTGREFDDVQSGSIKHDAQHNQQITGSGSIVFILDQTRYAQYKNLADSRTSCDIQVVAGSTAGSIFTFNLDACKIMDSTPINAEDNAIYEATINFKTIDGAAALGQLEIVCT